jgi:DnaJ like chaperone protein
MAAKQFDPADCTDCPKGLPGEDPAFATAVTALGAKLAMADGTAQAVEKSAFFEVFTPEEAAKNDVQRLYELARQTSLGFESYAKRLAKRYAACPNILEDVLEGLFHIAVSDGHLTDREETYLETVAALFGIKNGHYRRIRAHYVAPEADDPYILLGVGYGASLDEVKKARRDRLVEFHPDTVRARGLPPAYEALYTEKSALINHAYDKIVAQS